MNVWYALNFSKKVSLKRNMKKPRFGTTKKKA